MSRAQQAKAIRRSKDRERKEYFAFVRLSELRICLLVVGLFQRSDNSALCEMPVCSRAPVPMNKNISLRC